MSNFIVSILQSVILRHSDFEFEQVIAFEFSPLSYFQYDLRSISAIISYFTPQTFSTIPNSPYSRKYVLIRLTSIIGNPGFRNFVTSQKAYCRSVGLLVAKVYRFQ